MDWWMMPAQRPMMCDHLRGMIGETMRAEVRHPSGMRTYTGRLVAVGDDFIELEIGEADDRARYYEVESSTIPNEPEHLYPLESGQYEESVGPMAPMDQLSPMDESGLYSQVEQYSQGDEVESQQFIGGPFSRLLIPLVLLSTLYTYPRRRRRRYW
ncbi:hypothetical protein [Heliorestis convoluta]|uniref:Uncharacterized protein n=1 Tax=Heliorestis convoluta TaxID=356322 RepID=A0A5Q2N4K8_9FIRM|nr:hypothetical protein [Heliorestis convoluta]QGG48536.1 hypothetical protein FTV88_2439 [Heliorestis convoluta]